MSFIADPLKWLRVIKQRLDEMSNVDGQLQHDHAHLVAQLPVIRLAH